MKDDKIRILCIIVGMKMEEQHPWPHKKKKKKKESV